MVPAWPKWVVPGHRGSRVGKLGALLGVGSVSVSSMTKEPRAGADLTDDALQDEIELVGDLVVAATASDEPLTEDEIDRALGIERGHESAPEDTSATPHHVWKRQNA